MQYLLLIHDDPADYYDGLYEEFWVPRGFPGTPWDAQQHALSFAGNGGYRYWPEENFADAFGAGFWRSARGSVQR